MASESVVTELQRELQSRCAQAGCNQPMLADFAAAYFRHKREAQLGNRSASDLHKIAQAHLQLAHLRPGFDARVAVWSLDGSQHGCDCAAAVVVPDMPFAVATVLMAVRAVGATIDWVMHPVLRLTRDGQGRLETIVGAAEQNDHGDEESLVYIEFAAPRDLDQQALTRKIRRTLDDLSIVVHDYPPMRDQLERVIEQLGTVTHAGKGAECAAAQSFLRWLDDHHFTFLGHRQRMVEAGEAAGEDAMIDVPGSSLGLLREERPGIDPDGYVAPAEELDKYAQSPRVLVVTKANRRSWIHHAGPMDVVTVKRLDRQGNVIGAHRFLGLFSAEAYAASPRAIPVLDHKIAAVLSRAGFRPGSYDAKSLARILETFPRDELFQSSQSELFETALGVLAMRETEPLRLFLRRDRYGRFYACLVYITRERYTAALRRTVMGELERQLDGRVQESDSVFLRGQLVRLHLQVATEPGAESVDVAAVEHALRAATRSWPDEFAALVPEDTSPVLAYARAFSAGYMERSDPVDAVADARVLSTLSAQSPPLLTVAVAADRPGALSLKVFGVGAETSLSELLPVLENFGLAVRTQRPFVVSLPGGARQWIHEFEATHDQAQALEDSDRRAHLAAAFAQVITDVAENDGLNRLIVGAGLTPRQVVLVRAMTRYLLQTRLPLSARYLESVLADHASMVADMVHLFELRMDPDRQADGPSQDALVAAIDARFDAIASLDTDRALRALLGVVRATLRSNYYQQDANGQPKPYISLKLDPSRVPELPQPVPAAETFVYSPEVEAVHLRGALVARGGLRWSDRQADFRTEVLGLLKAQMVKNAVIVPAGAKGGFVVKNVLADDGPETRRAKGIAGYQTFIRGLLDITDNRTPEGIAPPRRVLRHDGDDPYLVVAADKGTAGFSDIANALSQEYGYWLDDAFASGGSAGYDHKGMGITARGAWESVKRHFRELGRDTQSEPFTVVAIGDMGGDVFGNGMLQSRHIRLQAAFNHQHVFIDPDPDCAASFAERRRLFELERSAWSDYDTSIISAGGGVYQRSAKRVDLSDQAMQALAIDRRSLTPDELIHELLKAPVDLLWNGGIGTYVKAGHQSQAQVGDHANDNLRVDGRDLRCKVVGEGGNLGMTQAGRIEYALAGGRLNTDAIDNSAGVNSSDIEVNIKIALGAAQASGQLGRTQRNRLLQGMTDQVAALVLRTNYMQSQQISMLAEDSVTRLDEQIAFMRTLEREGRLSRAIDGLPDDETIDERRRNQQGLTRPELALLLSHAKVALADAVLESNLPDDPYMEALLFAGFPLPMRDRHAQAIREHRLKRELITTMVSNRMVDRLGVAMAHRLTTDYGVGLADVVRAYVLADAWLGAESLYGEIEALDNQVAAAIQYRLFRRVNTLVKHAISWVLGAALAIPAITPLVERYQGPTQQLFKHLQEHMGGDYLQRWQANHDRTIAAGIQPDLAARMASSDAGGGLLDIVSLADEQGADAAQVARIYFALGERLGLAWLHRGIQALHVDGRWPALARSSLRGDCYRVHQRLVGLVLDAGAEPQSWLRRHAEVVEPVCERIDELRIIENPEFAHLALAVRALAQLATKC